MNVYPFVMTPFRPSVKYIIYKTSPIWLLYYLSIPPIFLMHPLLIIVNLLILMLFFYRFFLLCSELYLVSPDMIFTSVGLINNKVEWVDPLAIKDFIIIQSRLMRYLGVCQLTVVFDDEVGSEFHLKGIDVDSFRESLKLSIEVLKIRQGYSGIITRLVDLAKL